MDYVRIGLIGLGVMGRGHARYLLDGKITRAKLTATADPRDRLDHPDVRHFERGEDLIRARVVDAVLIATPHFSHVPLAIAALKRGLHVLVEKPVAPHKRDAERLIAAHTNKNLVLAAMFNQRTDPRYAKIRELVADGTLGRIQRFQWTITDWFRTNAYYRSNAWRATWNGEGGGVLLNQCPHQLDLLQRIFGMPSRVRATCRLGRFHPIEVEDDVTAFLEYADGKTGVFIATTGEAPGSNRLEIAGDKGRLVLDAGKLTITRNEVPASEFCRTSTELFSAPKTISESIIIDSEGGQHAAIAQNFVDAILDGAPLLSPAAEGVASLELANAMIQSSVMEKSVALPLDGRVYERLLKKLAARAGRRLAAFADEIAPDLDVQIEQCLRHGIRHIELRGVWNKNVLDLTDSERRLVRDKLNGCGMAVACIGSPIGKVALDASFDEHFERFKIAVDAAEFFGAPFIRIFSYYPPGSMDRETFLASSGDEIIERMRRKVDFIGQRDITLLHENEAKIFGERSRECRMILDGVASPRFRAAFDFANFVQCGEDPLAAWNALRDFVVHFHIKDARTGTGEVVPAGQGDGRMADILKDAIRSGYRGFFSLEPHLAAHGPFSGFTGPALFQVAVESLNNLLASVDRPTRATRGGSRHAG
jgi:predicted dehydrogenase/sugar phosphate isomerase/epimerase